jgi:hypothetical protein
MNSFVKIGIGFGAVVAVSIAMIFWLTAGENHEVQASFSTMLSDARRYDGDAVMSFFSMQYNHNGYTYGAIARAVKSHLAPDQFESIEERKVKYDVQGEYLAFVDAELVAVHQVMGRTVRTPIRIRLRYEKDAGRWLIVAADYETLPR